MLGDELLIALGVFLILLLVALFILQRKQGQHYKSKIDALTLLVKEADKQRDTLKQEIQELRSGTIGVGRRVMELEKRIAAQDVRLDESVQQEPQSRLYSRAIKMVQLGAGVNELMQECELPKAEAELLLRLHSR
ncbi:DUF2802 domain-containing protein [Shewanella sp. A3A]|uniref:DUF2802 domain-containing protein n=1 Tax=Shewanella electrica TaxID=515560 RepID=A0ABT2FJI5_9GAMM|nr:DUF2802 domain-containing protein [Shewanella electrica]MCH1920558.1 DUF2802 domain-containing protein [Shewanella ferrihydritica]MCH1924596.1 DUF2802 domain-containing protein [Shewanella electrica]MCS4556497.1 DUF2802 domain-containing protein [Shewanella electrica]